MVAIPYLAPSLQPAAVAVEKIIRLVVMAALAVVAGALTDHQ
jgi:hypothetical protein